VISHAIESLMWQSTFAPGSSGNPWFLNSGRAVAFTAACLLLAAVLATALERRRPAGRRGVLIAGVTVAAGAWVAMAVVLATIGPGTIFPIALAFAAAVAAVSCGIGALLGSML
jgi:hypothetical protein